MRARIASRPPTAWLWTVALRLGLAVAMAVYTVTFKAPPTHRAPGGLLARSLLLVAAVVALAVAQAIPRLRGSRWFAAACLVADAVALFVLIGLHAVDPRRAVFGLVVVVQAEGGLVLGLPGAVGAWGATAAVTVVLEFVSSHVSGAPVLWRVLVLQVAAGALLAIGAGALSEELSGERSRQLAQRERELRSAREAEARFRSLVERTPAVTYVETGARLRSTAYMSPQVAVMLGYPPAEWTNDPELWASRLHPDDRSRVLADADRVTGSGDPFVEEYRLIARDGRIVWVRDEAVSLPGPEGDRAWQGVMVDITERKRAEQQVTYLAYHDSLTGLPNRTMFEEALGLALARARRNGTEVAVLYLDLDDFKRINDTLGHGAGDDVLRQVAGHLQGAVRESDMVARHGGDEFLVLLADLPGPDGEAPHHASELAHLVAERMRASLVAPLTFAGSELRVSGSIGIALSRGQREDEAWLVRRADAAMYRTKREAPGGIALATDEDESVPGEVQAAGLRRAIEGEGLVVHYLPVVDLATAHVVGVEALVRWKDESGRLVPPAEFLTLAEDLGLIGAIDERVMAAAFERCRAWEAEGLDLDQVSVNLSAMEVAGADLHGDMMRRIEASGVDPARVMIEVPESSALTEGRARQALAALHDAGVRLAVDDFGTGVSSLAGLRDLPIDVIKLDRPLLRGVPDDPGAMRLLEAVVALIRSLGAQPMAEGVETEGQRTALLAMGCTLGQGFRFSPAVPAEEFERLVRSGSIGG